MEFLAQAVPTAAGGTFWGRSSEVDLRQGRSAATSLDIDICSLYLFRVGGRDVMSLQTRSSAIVVMNRVFSEGLGRGSEAQVAAKADMGWQTSVFSHRAGLALIGPCRLSDDGIDDACTTRISSFAAPHSRLRAIDLVTSTILESRAGSGERRGARVMISLLDSAVCARAQVPVEGRKGTSLQ